MSKWLTMGEARRVLKMGPVKIREMVESRELMGRYHSGRWVILRAHVECIGAGVMTLNDKPKAISDRAEYFQKYQSRRKELAWPTCTACKTKARKLPDVGCLECLARITRRRDWSVSEEEILELFAGKEGPTHLQLRIYHETGEPRTRGALNQKIKELGIKVMSHQDGYTIPQLMEITGHPYTTIKGLITEGVIKNIGKGSRVLISIADGEKVIHRYCYKGPPSYSLKEATRILGCSEEAIRKAMNRSGVPSWKEGHIRRVCKATIDRAVSYLRETGDTRVKWRLIVK